MSSQNSQDHWPTCSSKPSRVGAGLGPLANLQQQAQQGGGRVRTTGQPAAASPAGWRRGQRLAVVPQLLCCQPAISDEAHSRAVNWGSHRGSEVAQPTWRVKVAGSACSTGSTGGFRVCRQAGRQAAAERENGLNNHACLRSEAQFWQTSSQKNCQGAPGEHEGPGSPGGHAGARSPPEVEGSRSIQQAQRHRSSSQACAAGGPAWRWKMAMRT